MAGQIPPQFIDDLLSRVDIVDVIDSRVALKKAGKNMQACCPFHTEKSPSFTVSPEKQFYHCFGCGAHGTAIGFLMEYDQMTFPEAVEELANLAGLTVPTQQYQQQQGPSKQPLYALLEKVADYYVQQLHHHPNRAVFHDYLAKRGLSSEVVKHFQLGMAADGWDNVLKQFGGNSAALTQLKAVGLLSDNDKGRHYDKFRHRLMFPIRDRRGRVVGFGGRVLDDSTPKYLNSPETVLFHKGEELYGLFQARKANRVLQRVIIVEGYMDVIALAEAGISNAVATLGTATTEHHLKQLQRVTEEVVFCFDGDKAGRNAAWRAAENALPLLEGNQQFRFLFLPDGEDPDTMVKQHGAEHFEVLISTAMTYSDFFFDSLASKVDMGTMDGRARLIQLAKPYLSKMPAGVYRSMLTQQLAEKSATNNALLDQHIPKAASKPVKRQQPVLVGGGSPVRVAITIIVQYPSLARQVENYQQIHTLTIAGIDVLLALLELVHKYPQINHSASLLERTRPHSFHNHLTKLAVQPLTLAPEALVVELIDIVDKLSLMAIQQRQAELTAKPFSTLTAAEKEEIKQWKT